MAINGGWQKITMILIALLLSIAIGCTKSVSADGKKRAVEQLVAGKVRDARLAVAEENIRNLHFEKQIDRDLLNRIDLNTGGEGDAPDVRPLREAN